MEFILYSAIILLIFLLIEFLFRKWLGIEKKKITDSPGKNINRWGGMIISVIYLCVLPFMTETDGNAIKWLLILYVFTSMGFAAFLEWRYLKKSKEYLITLIFMGISVTIIYNLDYFFG